MGEVAWVGNPSGKTLRRIRGEPDRSAAGVTRVIPAAFVFSARRQGLRFMIVDRFWILGDSATSFPQPCNSRHAGCRENEIKAKIENMQIMRNAGGLIAVMALSVGCVSQPLKIPNVASNNYEVIGAGKGGATGIMLFNFIPIGQNERFVRAYDEAVQSQGGDALVDPVITENWFWGYILNGYITTIEGTVVKYK